MPEIQHTLKSWWQSVCQGIIRVGWVQRNKNQSSKSENKRTLRRNTTHLGGYIHGVMFSLWRVRSVGIENELSHLATKEKKKKASRSWY